jgi:hypothetical protein
MRADGPGHPGRFTCPHEPYEGIFGKIPGAFNIHFQHIENPYGVYRAGNRDRTAVPGPRIMGNRTFAL